MIAIADYGMGNLGSIHNMFNRIGASSEITSNSRRNAVKIFNEKEVDELVILEIKATFEKKRPLFEIVREIVSKAFMPVAYVGGIRSVEDARTMLQLGIEKR